MLVLCSFTAFNQEGQTPQCGSPDLTPEEFIQLPYFGLSKSELAAATLQLQNFSNDQARGNSTCGNDEGFIYMPIHIYDHTINGLDQEQMDLLMKTTNDIYAQLCSKFKFLVSCLEKPFTSPFTNRAFRSRKILNFQKILKKKPEFFIMKNPGFLIHLYILSSILLKRTTKTFINFCTVVRCRKYRIVCATFAA